MNVSGKICVLYLVALYLRESEGCTKATNTSATKGTKVRFVTVIGTNECPGHCYSSVFKGELNPENNMA